MIQFYDTFPTHFFIEMCYGRKNDFGVIYDNKKRKQRIDYKVDSPT